MRIVAGIAIAMLFAVPCAAADSDAMAKAAGGFYAAYKTFHPSDGIPDPSGRARYAPFASTGLNKLLSDAATTEENFARSNKNTPPLIEGDLFTSNSEGATSLKIGTCTGEAATGHCAIELHYTDGKDQVLNWIDTAYLVNEGGSWRVDDIGYGGTWDYGNKGRMRDTLKMVIRDAGN